MDFTMFEIIGQIVVGIIATALIILILDCIRDFCGYIRGAFNYRKHGVYFANTSNLTLIKIGAKKWLRTWRHGSGWFVSVDGLKLYENGRVEVDNWYPA